MAEDAKITPEVIRTVKYEIKARENASGAFKSVGKAAEDAGRKAKAAAGSQGFGALKKALGEESAFGNTVKILAGAGAIAGMTALARVASNFADNAAKAQEAFEKGEISAREMRMELFKAAPIIGEWVKAGDSIGKWLDGTAARERRATARDSALWQVQNATEAAQGAGGLAQATGKAIADEIAKSLVNEFGTPQERLMQRRREEAAAGRARVGAFDTQASELTARVTAADSALQGMVSGFTLSGDVARLDRMRDALKASLKKIQAEKSKAVSAQATAELRRATEDVQDYFGSIFGAYKKVIDTAAYGSSRLIDAKAGFAREDAVASLEQRRTELLDAIRGGQVKPSIGATASAFNDFGANALLAARSVKTDDPGVTVLKENQRTLKEIERQIKGMRDDARNRSRQEVIQSIVN